MTTEVPFCQCPCLVKNNRRNRVELFENCSGTDENTFLCSARDCDRCREEFQGLRHRDIETTRTVKDEAKAEANVPINIQPIKVPLQFRSRPE